MFSWTFLIAIAAMALLTYSTRALPFVIMHKSKWLTRLGQGRLAIMGSALLASTTTVVVYSEIHKATDSPHVWVYLLAVLSVVVVVQFSKNIAWAMLTGLLMYGVGLLYLV